MVVMRMALLPLFISVFIGPSSWANNQAATTAEPVLTSPELKSGVPDDPTRTKQWSLNAGIEMPTHRFLLAVGQGRSSLAASDQRLQFDSSNSPESVINLSWNNLGLEYRSKIDSLNSFASGDNRPGELHEVRLQFKDKIFGLEAFYQRVNGYYVDLNSSSGFTVSEGQGIQATAIGNESPTRGPDIWARPDVKSANYGLNAWMSLPFMGGPSSEAIFTDPDANWLLLKMTLATGYQRLAIEGAEPLIPQSRQATFGLQQDLLGVYQHALSASMGVRMEFLISERFVPYFEGLAGGEALMQSIQYRSELDRDLDTGRLAQFGIGAEYRLASFDTHAFWRMQMRSSTIESATLDSMLSSLGFDVTYRF